MFENFSETLSKIANTIAVATSIAAAAYAFSRLTIFEVSSVSPDLDKANSFEKRIMLIEDDLRRVGGEIQAISDTIRNAPNLPREGKTVLDIQIIQKRIEDIRDRQAKIEQVILANPAKALEIPLIQRDLDGLKAVQQANIQAVKEGVDRIYDLNKWLLGAMAISVIALAIGNFLKPRESKD